MRSLQKDIGKRCCNHFGAGGDERLRFRRRARARSPRQSSAQSGGIARFRAAKCAFFPRFRQARSRSPVAPEGEVLALELVEIVGRQFKLRRGAVDKQRRKKRIELGEGPQDNNYTTTLKQKHYEEKVYLHRLRLHLRRYRST